MLAPFSAPLAARILNALLAREPWARERLRPHAGKAVRLAVGSLVLVLRIRPDGRVDPASDSTPAAVSIRADAPTLVRVALPTREARPQPGAPDPITAALHIEGEAALAQVAGELARDLRWDGEEELARLVGDLPARLIHQTLSTALSLARDSAERFAQNTSEYVTHEARLLANPAAVADWHARVGELDQRVDALEARIEAALRNQGHA